MKKLVDFLSLIIIYFVIFYRRWKSQGREVLFINTVMYIYLSFVLYFTLMPILISIPFMFNHPYKSMNMNPFIDVLMHRGDFIRQIGLNILMTVPFGFLLPLVKDENTKLLKVILYTFLLSFGIEILQPLTNGFKSADITDIITNVIGGIMGYTIYLILKPLINKCLYHIRKKNRLN